jgi:transcriptional regulator with XRE-family HTH domain
MADTEIDSAMTAARNKRGLSLVAVAAAVGTTDGNLSRIERGIQTPMRAQARALYRFFDGALTLGQCYDPCFAQPTGKRRRK